MTVACGVNVTFPEERFHCIFLVKIKHLNKVTPYKIKFDKINAVETPHFNIHVVFRICPKLATVKKKFSASPGISGGPA